MQTITKKEIPEIIELEIEKLSNLGFGIGKIEGYVIFVEGACPGDKLRVRIGKKNKTYAYGTILEIITPSKNRVSPFCPMQKVCGSCQLQHIDYKAQLKYKNEIVRDTMRSIYGCNSDNIEIRETIPSPIDKEYRCKIQYPVSQTRDSKRIVAGYYKTGSHEIVNIKYCPIQPAYCDEIIEFIKEEAKSLSVSGYIEKNHSGDLKHIVIRASKYNNKAFVTMVINSPKCLEKVKQLAQNIYNKFNFVSGVGLNYNPKKTNLILGEETEIIIGDDFVEEKLCDKIFKIGAKTFFQVNPLNANNIFEYVKNYISKNIDSPLILDAYAGITAFGICLSDIAKKVVSVESEKESVDLASKIIKENGIRNVELHNMDASLFFEKEIRTKSRNFDIVLLDPPRKGCTTESLDYALKLAKSTIIYVSCNPATLARDLKHLTEQGCTIELIQPFDMFPHTYHIENVAIINTNK